MSESMQTHVINELVGALCGADDWCTPIGAAIYVTQVFEDNLTQQDRDQMVQALTEALALIGKARKAA